MKRKFRFWWIQFTYENRKMRRFIESLCEVENILKGKKR